MTKEREVYADAASAIARLTNNGIKVDTSTKTIEVFGQVGIKLWGAIDYLQNRVKYTWHKKG